MGSSLPDNGGEDVFLHASVLDGAVESVRPGMSVAFDAIAGEHGLRAYSAHLLTASSSVVTRQLPTAAPFDQAAVDQSSGEAEMCEMVTCKEFSREIIDVLISVAPAMTASRMVEVRDRLAAFAQARV